MLVCLNLSQGRQEAGGRRQEAGGRRQEAGGRQRQMTLKCLLSRENLNSEVSA